MKLRPKLNNLIKDFQDKKAEIRDTDFNDVTKVYKKVLKKIPDVSHLKNIVLFTGLATLAIFVMFAQRFANLREYLPTQPDFGGTYTEGVEGEINQLNPLFSPINNAETSATSLIFSGLTKRVDGRKVEPDLAESWEVSTNKKTYTFHLRQDLKWQDGEPLTADDVAFTFSKIQDPDVDSPYLATWKGVSVMASDLNTVTFELPNPYSSFLYLTNVPIIPKHILENIPAENLKSAEFSTAPVGSGPYSFEEFRELKDKQEVHLTVNKYYYGSEPFIQKVIIKAYKNYYQVIDAYKYREIMAIERLSARDLLQGGNLPNISTYVLSVPEYDNLTFNLKAGQTKDKSLREAIALVTDRQKIVDEVYDGWATPIRSAVLPGFAGYNKSIKTTLSLKAAQKKLKDAGYSLDKEGVLKKDGQLVSLRLVTVDGDIKSKEADLLADMIRQLGIEVEVEKYPFSTYIEDYVRTRNFDLLLVSQNLGAEADLYAYYHSKMIDDPGLNFSGINNREIDKYLEEARVTDNDKVRDARYQAISKILATELPAVYLVWPNYIFGASKDVQGITPMKLVEPKDKYSQIFEWYIKEKRDY